jgi:hypothetical protein
LEKVCGRIARILGGLAKGSQRYGERTLDVERTCNWIASIRKGFAKGLQGFENDSGFGKDLQQDYEDLESILDLGMICKRTTRICRGVLIWRGFAKGFWICGEDS